MKARHDIINNHLQDYDYITDGNTGQVMAVRRSTGEATEAIYCCVPIGTKFYTPAQQQAHKEWKAREREKSLRCYMNEPLGKFFFILSNEQFKGIAPETVTRLIYLNTFVSYDNKLMLTKRTPMKRKDLADVLSVSKPTITRFWQEVSPQYITEEDGSLIFINKDVFKRGRIKLTKEYIIYQKLYIDGIRTLYKATEKNNHRQLGYLFKLLPFINIEFNLLCFNPLETELDKVELISITEFCKMIDYDIKHLNKLLAIYRDVRFSVEGRQERFCAITYDGINRGNAKICINPHILYSGSDYNKVEILGAFCRA